MCLSFSFGVVYFSCRLAILVTCQSSSPIFQPVLSPFSTPAYCLLKRLAFLSLPVFLSVYLSVSLCIFLSLCFPLPLCVSLCLSHCLSVSPCLCQSVYICLS